MLDDVHRDGVELDPSHRVSSCPKGRQDVDAASDADDEHVGRRFQQIRGAQDVVVEHLERFDLVVVLEHDRLGGPVV